MSKFDITVSAGSSINLPTAGKYCEKDILITATGAELPELTNPATASEVFKNKEYIDSNGVKKIGAFTIDNELNSQDDLLTQLEAALEGKAAGGGVELPALTNPVTSDKILNGYDAIDDGGNRIVGTIPNTEVDYYECYVDETTGLVSPLMAINQGGYVSDGYIFNFTHQLPTKAGTTIIPTSSEQIAVPAGTYCTGDIKVAAASDGGSNGGSVEICTITITVNAYSSIYYTSFVNGNYVFNYTIMSSSGTKTISNVVVNSLITICYYTSQSAQRVEVTDNIVYDLSSFEYGGMLKTFGFHSNNAFGGTITIGAANASGGYGDGGYA